MLENLGDGRFREVEDSGLELVRVSRGLATGDLDGDADADLVIVTSNGVAEVYENLSLGGGWLAVDLRGLGKNRFGIGSRVTVESSGRRQVREVRTGSSYLSQSDLTLLFGLGEAQEVNRLWVAWPSGRRQVFEGWTAGKAVLAYESRSPRPAPR